MSRAHRLILFLVLSLAISPISALAGDDKISKVEFVVLHSYNGKPVRNASVVLHPVNKEGKQSKGGMELKTDADGKASLDTVPYGKIRVQAIAPGLQTYGEDFDITQPAQQITIKMNRPQEQYSIYK